MTVQLYWQTTSYIGNDIDEELGLGITYTKEITLIVEGVKNVCGYWHTVFCKMINGDIYAWGLNYFGQLGVGNIEKSKNSS